MTSTNYMSDISTAASRLRQHLRLVQSVQVALQDVSEADAAFALVLRSVCEAIGWAAGEVWTPTQAGNCMRRHMTWNTERGAQTVHDRHAASIPQDTGLIERARSDSVPVWAPESPLALLGLKTAVAVPVTAGSALAAVLAFYDCNDLAHDADLELLLTTVAAQLGSFLHRNQKEANLRHSEQWYRAIGQHFPNGSVYLFDREMRYQLAEGQKLDAFDLVPARLHGKTIYEVFEGEWLHFVEAMYLPILDGHTLEVEVDWNGRTHWLQGLPVTDDTGSVIAGMVITQDITERKAMERALRETEERYRLVAQATNDVIWDWQVAADTQTWSSGIHTIFGYNLSEINASIDWWSAHVHPDDYDRVHTCFYAVLNSRETEWHDEYRMRRADDSYAYVKDRGFIVRDERGKAVRMVGAMTDVTEQQKAVEDRNCFFDLSVDMLCIADTSGYFKLVNPAFQRTLGWTTEELLSKRFIEFVHPDDRAATMERARLAALGQALGHFENRYLCADGNYCWLSWRSVTVPETNRIYAVARDMTEKRRAEELMWEWNAELEQRVGERTAQLMAVNRELEAFSYSVSHDLRAPLRAIDGFSLALHEDFFDQLNDEGRFYLQRIRLATQRMGLLIDDLLKLSRVTRDDMTRAPVDLAALAREVVDELQEADPQRCVTFVAPSVIVANADARLIRTALANLIGNAWKFTANTAEARVEFAEVEHEGKRAFCVRDNGVGFDMAYADRLFGAFQRLHTQQEFEGTGIGLAIVARVIHRHGGEIWTQAAPGEGAKFYFTLP